MPSLVHKNNVYLEEISRAELGTQETSVLVRNCETLMGKPFGLIYLVT